jgi:hypothetical protein
MEMMDEDERVLGGEGGLYFVMEEKLQHYLF